MSIGSRWANLNPRERVVIIGAFCLVSLSVIVARVVPAWADWSSTAHANYTVLTDSLAGLRDLSSRTVGTADDAASERIGTALSQIEVLGAESSNEGTAQLMELIAAAADDVGTSVTSLQPLPGEDRPVAQRIRPQRHFERVAIRAVGSADSDMLPELLAFIDSSRVPLATTSLSVSTSAAGMSGRMSKVQFDIVVSTPVQVRRTRNGRGR